MNAPKTSSPKCGSGSRTITGYYINLLVKPYRGLGKIFILVSHRMAQDSREPVPCDSRKLVNWSGTGCSVLCLSSEKPKIKFMTDTKPVSVQACNRHAQPRKQALHNHSHYWRNSLRPTLLPCYPRAGNRTDASTDGSHLLRAPLITAADRRGSTVMPDTMSIFGGDIVEEPEPLEPTDRVVDRIRTDLVEALSSIWQPGSDP